MKTLLYIVAIIFCGCKNSTTNDSRAKAHTTISKKSDTIDKTKFYAKKDSIIIASKYFDTIIYRKKDFDEIVDNFPTLYENIPRNPDISYAESGYWRDLTDSAGMTKHLSFGSEIGQDQYYILYAYFLQKKNVGSELEKRRENLISIYRDLNDIFGLLSYGGTYFGHQFNRINGYAEYSVYQYQQHKDVFNKKYPIKEQKAIYLSFLKQKISDEVSVDNEVPDKAAKEKRKMELFNYVSHLDTLITDYFYLSKAEEFQFTNY